MTSIRALVVCCCAVLALAGCGSSESRTADDVTRAVYNDDIDSATKNFTPDLAKTVTRQELGQLSDLMHQHGDYKGLKQTGTEPDGAYDFEADFSNGTLIVKMKLDSSGKVSGYRVIPNPSM
ncbi:MAG TPA: hypothetical protein VEV38_11155 [Candidatus Eremiobacteraceae bacterium]|nr:hypothetical protein [Candidatus Eremiobacteraceae bacterium]